MGAIFWSTKFFFTPSGCALFFQYGQYKITAPGYLHLHLYDFSSTVFVVQEFFLEIAQPLPQKKINLVRP